MRYAIVASVLCVAGCGSSAGEAFSPSADAAGETAITTDARGDTLSVPVDTAIAFDAPATETAVEADAATETCPPGITPAPTDVGYCRPIGATSACGGSCKPTYEYDCNPTTAGVGAGRPSLDGCLFVLDHDGVKTFCCADLKCARADTQTDYNCQSLSPPKDPLLYKLYSCPDDSPPFPDCIRTPGSAAGSKRWCCKET